MNRVQLYSNSQTPILKLLLHLKIHIFNPNGVGEEVGCAHTFFRWLFLHERYEKIRLFYSGAIALVFPQLESQEKSINVDRQSTVELTLEKKASSAA